MTIFYNDNDELAYSETSTGMFQIQYPMKYISNSRNAITLHLAF